MAEKKVKSIIPDVPLYGTPGNAAGSGASKPQAPAKKNPSKAHAPVRKQAPAKPFADPKTGKITDIESLIEPPPKPEKEGINAATIEQAVKSSNIPMILMIFALIVFGFNMLLRFTGLHPKANYFFSVETEGNFLLEMFYKILPYPFLYLLPSIVILGVYMALVTSGFSLADKIKKNN